MPALSVNGGCSRSIQRHMHCPSRWARVRPYEQRKKYEKEQPFPPGDALVLHEELVEQGATGHTGEREVRQRHALHTSDDAVAHRGPERQYSTRQGVQIDE